MFIPARWRIPHGFSAAHTCSTWRGLVTSSSARVSLRPKGTAPPRVPPPPVTTKPSSRRGLKRQLRQLRERNDHRPLPGEAAQLGEDLVLLAPGEDEERGLAVVGQRLPADDGHVHSRD